MRTLVIGLGNPLRGDDAAGQLVAEHLQRIIAQPDVTVLACHQLTPELAQPISEAELVIFIDAVEGLGGDGVMRRVIEAGEPAEKWSTHRSGPAALLTVAGELYGHRPPALLVGIAASRFDVDAPLSERTRKGCETAIRMIGEMIDSHVAPVPGAHHA